jgi:pilus assembly protein FimV
VNYRKAIEQQLQLIEQSPHDARILMKAGELYQKAEEPKLAAGMFFRAAQCYLAEGLSLKAAALLKQVLRLVPHRVEAREILASTLLKLGLHDDAADQYQELLEHYRLAGAAEDVARLLETLTRLGIPFNELNQRE